ncbi:MAG: SRPBCC family protein [Gammaproteobacteria bacterium]|nr:SRPBCC family protein [Gammaproteobacteria bacterium]MXY57119.1 SRPBCC family protein [Gammaproteobacteria bacterium]MYF27313.1 SRPBCC family protein [Gammaproteobacteria bacterium]MYK46839.1 SRPBCC family protein [Gammaproteobacteria bacterium]
MPDSDAPSRQSDPEAVEVGDSKPVLVARMTDTMDADSKAVFATLAHGGRHGEAIPEVLSVDFVSEKTMGVGAQFRENRDWNAVQVMFAKFAKLHKNVIECIEYEPNRRVRYMSNGAGARWHSIYTLAPAGEGRTRVELRLEIRPKNLLGRWLPQLMKAPLQESTKNDFEAIKRHIENAQG